MLLRGLPEAELPWLDMRILELNFTGAVKRERGSGVNLSKYLTNFNLTMIKIGQQKFSR